MSQAPLIGPIQPITVRMIAEAIHSQNGQFYILVHHDPDTNKYRLPVIPVISDQSAYAQAKIASLRLFGDHFEERSLGLVDRLVRAKQHIYRCQAHPDSDAGLPKIAGHPDKNNLIEADKSGLDNYQWIAESEIESYNWLVDHHQIITAYLRTKSSGTEGF